MFYDLKKIDMVSPLFQAFENCKGVEQRADYHPEGDVFNHSLQVLTIAMKESNDIDLILAAMLHDIGKQINTLGHEQYSCDMVQGLISEKTKWLISQHIRIKWFLSGEMKKLGKIKELHSHPLFADLILLNRWDTIGRKPNWKPIYDRVTIIEKLQQK